jgi:hypothetical protein
VLDGGCSTNCGGPTDYATRSASDQAFCVVAKIRNLRQPIQTEINGQPCVLLTIGFVLRAIGRSKWTLRNWEKLGLFPEAPFVLRPDVPSARRHLYPAPFVQRLKEIAGHGYVGTRLDFEDWERFRDEVFDAYNETVTPLFAGVMPERQIAVGEGECPQGK